VYRLASINAGVYIREAVRFILLFIEPNVMYLLSGGLGFNATQLARMAEVTTLDPSIYVTLGAHQSIGLKVG
jgi:hypothetical protein